jgi:hypothetical protein
MNYDIQAIFSVLRLVIAFLFVFGFATPLFFKYAGKQKGIDRIVYSWVGLGGLLMVGVFILVIFQIYDFISILFCLIMLPFLIRFFKKKWEGESVVDIFNTAENTFIAKQVKLVEAAKLLTLSKLKERFLRKPSLKIERPYSLTAVGIGILAFVLRITPSIQNSSPFSRIWYFELDAIKSLSLQEYFSGYPTPKGMHSIIHIFSTITQVSPEMILHVIGSLISFFLTIIIFWILRDITRGRHQEASLFGALIYAVFPTLLLPVSMEMQSELTTLSLALCFALPTMVFFIRNVRAGNKIPWFYIWIGVTATGFSDVFVLLNVLLPFMVISLFSLPKKEYSKKFASIFLKMMGVYILVLSPYLVYLLYQGIGIDTFFQDQLFNTQVFSLTPNLIIPLQDLSVIYLISGAVLLLFYIIRHFVRKKKRIADQIVFLVLFMIISYVYTPYFDYQYVYIDPDQLNSFYGILISIFFGLTLFSVFTFLEWIAKSFKKILKYAAPVVTGSLAILLFVLQGGFEVSRMLPNTQPNGFFNAYYQIINERVPYTYATVGPELDRELSVNRHYFMNYQFFLNNYGAIDSLYQKYLTVPDIQRSEVEEIPPASIFIFLEKPPYGSIQQGILYNAEAVMRDLEQWLDSFQEMEGRTLRVYHETEQTVVYEIVNREDESTITGVLRNIYPTEAGRAAKLFQ